MRLKLWPFYCTYTGEVGDWRNHLNNEAKAKIDAYVERYFKGSSLKFTTHLWFVGFHWPPACISTFISSSVDLLCYWKYVIYIREQALYGICHGMAARLKYHDYFHIYWWLIATGSCNFISSIYWERKVSVTRLDVLRIFKGRWALYHVFLSLNHQLASIRIHRKSGQFNPC